MVRSERITRRGYTLEHFEKGHGWYNKLNNIDSCLKNKYIKNNNKKSFSIVVKCAS